ncbi:MAG TPA: hypothetical protein VIJ07_03645, partial [Dermatophilaceae bacterium]
RPAGDWPDTAHIAVDLARVRAVLHRIAADLDELARARRIADLNTAATPGAITPGTPEQSGPRYRLAQRPRLSHPARDGGGVIGTIRAFHPYTGR